MKRIYLISLTAVIVAISGVVFQNTFREKGTAAKAPLGVWDIRGTSALDNELTRSEMWIVRSIQVTAPGVNSGTLQVRKNSSSHADYNNLAYGQDMSEVTDGFHIEDQYWLSKNDSLHFLWANPTGNTWALEVYYELAQ